MLLRSKNSFITFEKTRNSYRTERSLFYYEKNHMKLIFIQQVQEVTDQSQRCCVPHTPLILNMHTLTEELPSILAHLQLGGKQGKINCRAAMFTKLCSSYAFVSFIISTPRQRLRDDESVITWQSLLQETQGREVKKTGVNAQEEHAD